MLTVIIPLCRLPPVAEGVDPPGTDEKVESILTTSRAAYEKLRQRATVLKVAREQGWHVAKELATLQDQEEDPLLKKAIKNASRRYTIIIIFFSATFFVSHTFFIFLFHAFIRNFLYVFFKYFPFPLEVVTLMKFYILLFLLQNLYFVFLRLKTNPTNL